MSDPVFVVHGVANRDHDGFTTAVKALQSATGLAMEPVYWGDLGAEDRFVHAALPDRDTGPGALFDGAEQPYPTDQLAVVDAALREELDAGPGPLRDGPDGPPPEEILDCLAEEWPHTRWLSRTDDAGLLAETGRALARSLQDTHADTYDLHGYDGLRGEPGALRESVRRRLQDLDRVAGAAIGAVAGRVNQAVRARFGPGTARFLGDVLVYQRHRDAVHARVRQRIDEIDPALGRSPDRPVRVVAHSLGGVIAVDMATAEEPLWTGQLVTFGSQAAFFHACDPRGGQLLPYGGQEPVRLPASLARWTNLWEPLDLLAFAASRVFLLSDGSSPVDRPVPHAVGAGLWTHSAYWDLPDVATAITEAMDGTGTV